MNKGIVLDLCLKLRNWRKLLILQRERKNQHGTMRYLYTSFTMWDFKWFDCLFYFIGKWDYFFQVFSLLGGNSWLQLNFLFILPFSIEHKLCFFLFSLNICHLNSTGRVIAIIYLVNSELSYWSFQMKIFIIMFKLHVFCEF